MTKPHEKGTKHRSNIDENRGFGGPGGSLGPFWPPRGPRAKNMADTLVRWTPAPTAGAQNASKIDMMALRSAFWVYVLGLYFYVFFLRSQGRTSVVFERVGPSKSDDSTTLLELFLFCFIKFRISQILSRFWESFWLHFGRFWQSWDQFGVILALFSSLEKTIETRCKKGHAGVCKCTRKWGGVLTIDQSRPSGPCMDILSLHSCLRGTVADIHLLLIISMFLLFVFSCMFSYCYIIMIFFYHYAHCYYYD